MWFSRFAGFSRRLKYFLDGLMEGLKQRDRFVCEEVTGRRIPLACIVGGGYSKDVSCVAARHAIVTQEAAKVWRSRQMYKNANNAQ